MADSVIVNIVAQYIAFKIKRGSKTKVKVIMEVNELSRALKNVNIQGVTELDNSYEVNRYVEELRRIAYEAEDEVDTLLSKSSTISFLWAHRSSKKFRMLKERTISVNKQLEEHAKRSDKEVMLCARGSQAPKGHLPADGDLVIGIDQEIRRVIDQLTAKSESNCRFAIVGMGGSGKTTLARSIYSNKSIKRHFHFQAWVSVSQGWDTATVLLDILKQIRQQKWFCSMPDNDEEHELNELVTQLNQLIGKKTCFLVLDDVWDMQSLNKFIALIQGCDFDSRQYTVVITSRQNPPNNIKWCIHQPPRLNDDYSWQLLSLVASNSDKARTDDYHALAMEMLRKCQGLPLAIVALGRLLKTKDTKHEWQTVFSQITGTDATSMYGPVNEILGLSYDELPNYLKPCFLYLGMFPEGSAISGGALIKMWIAEGFVECNTFELTYDVKGKLEMAGRRYLQELIDHTMVEVVCKTYSGKTKTIRVHDIMRDFCMVKASDLDFLTVSSSEASRRAAINLSQSILPANNSHLRSLSLFGKSGTSAVPERYTSRANQRYIDLGNVSQMYKLLRVLDIFGIKSLNGILPREIGDLIHLTYLRIRSTNIRELPKSIGKLLNLLTLDYWDVSVDTEVIVPNVLWKLERLRHLYLPNEMSGTVKDLKLDTLNDLITLWGVRGEHWMHKNMDRLNSTVSKLYIHHISTEDQLNAVLSCPAIEKNSCLYALALEWYSFDLKSLDELLAKQSLQKLRLSGKTTDKSHHQGLEFPSNLGKLELHYTHLENPETMTLLGKLVFLKVLRLSKNAYVGSEWNCAKQAFPKLEELKLDNLPNLETWVMEKGALPCLKTLSIVSCVNLKKMPEGFKFVQSLRKLDIEHMPYNFRCRLQKFKESGYGRGEDFHIIKHIAQVNVRGSVTPLLY